MSPMKEAKEAGLDALVCLGEAFKHLGQAGMGIVTPLAQEAKEKAEKAISKAITEGKPQVAKALANASLSLGKASDSLNQMAREMSKPEPKAPATGE